MPSYSQKEKKIKEQNLVIYNIQSGIVGTPKLSTTDKKFTTQTICVLIFIIYKEINE